MDHSVHDNAAMKHDHSMMDHGSSTEQPMDHSGHHMSAAHDPMSHMMSMAVSFTKTVLKGKLIKNLILFVFFLNSSILVTLK